MLLLCGDTYNGTPLSSSEEVLFIIPADVAAHTQDGGRTRGEGEDKEGGGEGGEEGGRGRGREGKREGGEEGGRGRGREGGREGGREKV